MMMAAFSPMLVVAAEMPVSAVQETLKREQFFFGEPSGVLDEPTRAALRRFQIRQGLPVSGEIDTATVQALQNPRAKDAAVAPAPVAGAAPKAGSAAATTTEKDREFLQDLQQAGTAPGKVPAAPPETPQVTSEATARIVSPRRAVEDDAEAPPRTGAPVSEPTRRVVTRTTTTIVTDGAETDDGPDPLEPNGVRIIRPPGTAPVAPTTVPQERTRIIEERRTTTVSPEAPPPARAPASTPKPGLRLPTFPQADEPPSRVLPEAPSRKSPGFFQRLFRGDR
jgi:peptidoglycan hydrolase-like protein with peptidoglycan-binding domain